MAEKWLDIEGFDGRYQISSDGRVKSFVHNRYPAEDIILAPYIHTSRLKQHKEAKPKLIVKISLGNDIRKTRYVSALVWKAFVGPIAKGKQIIHKDGNYKNCKLKNLICGEYEIKNKKQFKPTHKLNFDRT